MATKLKGINRKSCQYASRTHSGIYLDAQMVTITIPLTEEQAESLAQFCKRIGYGTLRSHTTTDDDAYLMQSAIVTLQKELKFQGFDPR
ncbi:MAG: hypothetical protein M0Q44_01155 [Methylobacter sp.]|nr:hypothetical protein [Methylobacter sp.]